MLTVEQVKPFLVSADPECRRLAKDYFGSKTNPLLTADEWWEVFDANNKVPNHLLFHPVMVSRQSAGSTGRNDPCPCGSGKKYKKCCLK